MTDESRSTPEEPSAASQPRALTSRRRGPLTSADASLLGLGTQMLSEVVAGVLLGYGLDYMLGTSKRWVVVGAIAGVAVSMVTVFRVALRPPKVGSGANSGANSRPSRGPAEEPPRERH